MSIDFVCIWAQTDQVHIICKFREKLMALWFSVESPLCNGWKEDLTQISGDGNHNDALSCLLAVCSAAVVFRFYPTFHPSFRVLVRGWSSVTYVCSL